MHALQHCDFCDGDAAGTFEVLPPELEPTEAEQRRVVLCRGCKRQLGALLEPLLTRLQERPPSDEAAGTETVDRNSDGNSGTISGAGSEITFGGGTVDDPEEPPSSTETDTTAAGTDESDATTETESAADSTPKPRTQSASERTATQREQRTDSEIEAGSGVETGTEAEADATTSDSDSADETETDTTTDATDATESAETTDETTDATETEDTPSPTPASATSQTQSTSPRAYAKVIRLLRNRDLPMKRDAVESLAAGAYDLESTQAAAVVDHAIEQDEFTERDGKLHRS